MIPFSFPETNTHLERVAGTLDLPVCDDGRAYTSFWKFNKEELEEIQRTGGVYLSIITREHPPVHVYAFKPLKYPREIAVIDSIATKIYALFYLDEEYIVVNLDEGEVPHDVVHDCKEWYDLHVEKDGNIIHHKYLIMEPIRIAYKLSIADERVIMQRCGWKNIAVLERLIKTKFEEDGSDG